jgi:alpha-1,2-mannosyltransferase
MRSRWIWLLATAGLAFVVGAGWYLAVARGRAYDFGAFFFAAQAVRSGQDPYAVTPEGAPPYVYPPLLAQAGAALPPWPRDTAYRRLEAATCIAVVLALGLTLLYRLGRSEGGEDDAQTLVVGLALLLILPFRDNLAQGQVNGFVVLAVAMALWLESRGRDFAAGLAFAPAVLLKLTPAVFALWWLARRRGRALAGLAAGSAALVLASLAAGGSSLWASYLRLLRGLAAGKPPAGLPPLDAPFNFSAAGFCARLLPPAWSGPATLVVLLVLVLLAGRAAARATDPASAHGALLAVLALTVVAPPLSYRHHVIVVLPAALLFLADARAARARGRAALVLLGLLLASVNFPDRAGYLRLDAAGGPWRVLTSLNLYGLLLLFATGWRRACVQRFTPWVS